MSTELSVAAAGLGVRGTSAPAKSVPAAATLTLIGNTSGASLTDITNGLKLTQTSFASNTGAQHVAAVKTLAAPASAWSATFEVYDLVQRVNFANGTFVLSESATGKTLTIGTLRANTFLSETRQHYSTYAAMQLSTTVAGGTQSGSWVGDYYTTVPFRRVRFSYDATNLKIDVSFDDGENWLNLYSQVPTAYGFTTRPDQVGFGLLPYYEDAIARLCTSVCKDFTLS